MPANRWRRTLAVDGRAALDADPAACGYADQCWTLARIAGQGLAAVLRPPKGRTRLNGPAVLLSPTLDVGPDLCLIVGHHMSRNLDGGGLPIRGPPPSLTERAYGAWSP